MPIRPTVVLILSLSLVACIDKSEPLEESLEEEILKTADSSSWRVGGAEEEVLGPVLLTGSEVPDPGCAMWPLIEYKDLETIEKLPDPFTFIDGTRVKTFEDWACRRGEIQEQISRFELGPKPWAPKNVQGKMKGEVLTIEIEEGNKSIEFDVDIDKPESTDSLPAIIIFQNSSLPLPPGVARIIFNNSAIAEQQNGESRGEGKFYELYGSNHQAGALMAWAWGVSRIVDAIENMPEVGIDPARIAVTGCSRNGKGALVAGAYDARIALTIPQESGSGGTACWRVSDYQNQVQEEVVQTASQIVTENVWFRTNFSRFGSSVNKLPYDHHMLAGLVAPRGLLMIENTDQIWLGALSGFTCGTSAMHAWDALDVSENVGFSQYGHASHCSFPKSQEPELLAFIDKFLFDQSADTVVYKSDIGVEFDKERWIDWQVPELENK